MVDIFSMTTVSLMYETDNPSLDIKGYETFFPFTCFNKRNMYSFSVTSTFYFSESNMWWISVVDVAQNNNATFIIYKNIFH